MSCWIAYQGKRYGPYSEPDLQRMILRGVPAEAQVWIPSFGRWIPASRIGVQQEHQPEAEPAPAAAQPGSPTESRPTADVGLGSAMPATEPRSRTEATESARERVAQLDATAASRAVEEPSSAAGPLHAGGSTPNPTTQSDDDATGRVCPYCFTAITGTAAWCPNCRSPHHQDCYQGNGGCAVLGCRLDDGSTAAASQAPVAVGPVVPGVAPPAYPRPVTASSGMGPQPGPAPTTAATILPGAPTPYQASAAYLGFGATTGHPSFGSDGVVMPRPAPPGRSRSSGAKWAIGAGVGALVLVIAMSGGFSRSTSNTRTSRPDPQPTTTYAVDPPAYEPDATSAELEFQVAWDEMSYADQQQMCSWWEDSPTMLRTTAIEYFTDHGYTYSEAADRADGLESVLADECW